MRKTKIVATVGPACRDEKIMRALIREGVDVVRINASHTTVQGLCEWIVFVRSVAASLKKDLPILVDLQGPRVRTGQLREKRPLLLRSGDEVLMTVSSAPGAEGIITTTCRELPLMVKKGDAVLLDNGLMRLKVLGKAGKTVQLRVLAGGLLGENKGINLPQAPVTLPALTPKDKVALKAAAAMGVSYVALSFVRSRDDVETVKAFLKKRRSTIPVIAKIEKPRAVTHIGDILSAADGIMVARGDLGIELGVERVPAIQKELIERSNAYGVPVITATQMLESMMDKTTPSRAEVSDIANAVFDGTDAVMLSGETAVGKFPVETVRMMARIIVEAERRAQQRVGEPGGGDRFSTAARSIAHAAYHAAEEMKAKAIVAFTVSGKTALLVSKLRPEVPVIAMASSEKVALRLQLLRGVYPLTMVYSKSTDSMVHKADQAVISMGFMRRGDYAVLVSGKQALPAARFMAKIHCVGDH
ncbi:MAG TPA: pyruvate kinase [Verrucomicrobiae bacterium]|jgi:pyruvate kinase|nr:pyruvate kinase [Verrucomicrobiae bacterium]